MSRSEQQAVVEQFLIALQDRQAVKLMEMMAPDVVLIADGGGIAAAALASIHGSEPVATPPRVRAALPRWRRGPCGSTARPPAGSSSTAS